MISPQSFTSIIITKSIQRTILFHVISFLMQQQRCYAVVVSFRSIVVQAKATRRDFRSVPVSSPWLRGVSHRRPDASPPSPISLSAPVCADSLKPDRGQKSKESKIKKAGLGACPSPRNEHLHHQSRHPRISIHTTCARSISIKSINKRFSIPSRSALLLCLRPP